MKLIIYKDGNRWSNCLYLGKAKSFGKKQVSIIPIESGHFNGYRSRVNIEHEVVGIFDKTEDNVKLIIEVLKESWARRKQYTDELGSLKTEYSKDFETICNKLKRRNEKKS